MGQSLLNIDKEFKPVMTLVSILAFSVFLFYATIIIGDTLYFPMIATSFLVAYLIAKNPKYWLYLVFLTSPMYLISNEKDFDVSDAMSAVLWIGGLFVWLFYHVLIHRKKLVEDISDWFFIFFYLCMILNFFVAVLNENDLEIWIRTGARFTIPLLYFPIKDHFRTKSEFRQLLKVLLISFLGLSLYMLYLSAVMVQDVKNAWELGGLLRLNQGLIGVSILTITAVTLFQKGWNKLTLALILVPFIIVFMVSLSRIFWIGLIIGIFYSIFFLPKSQRKVIFIAFSVIFLSAIIAVFVFLGDKASFILSLYLDRFSSIGNFMEDQSFLVRFDEYKYAIREIIQNPWAGNGFSHKISYYNKLTSTNWITNNVHNGYILITMRFGIPLALIYYSVIVYKFVKSINYLKISKYSLEKMVLLGLSAGYLLMFVSNFLTASFMTRDGDLLVALMFALTAITIRLIKEDVSK